MEKTEYVTMYSEYLREEGFSPTVDEDGDIVFKFEGSIFYLVMDEETNYFRLIYPAFWSIDSEAEQEAAMRSALEVTKTIRVVKINIIKESVWATFETFCANPEDYKILFRRALNLLRAASRRFAEKMMEKVILKVCEEE